MKISLKMKKNMKKNSNSNKIIKNLMKFSSIMKCLKNYVKKTDKCMSNINSFYFSNSNNSNKNKKEKEKEIREPILTRMKMKNGMNKKKKFNKMFRLTMILFRIKNIVEVEV
jgi:hypothetical protein